jgi:transposase InsO family protein
VVERERKPWRASYRLVAIASQSASLRRCYGPEFIAKKVRAWIGAVGAKTAWIGAVGAKTAWIGAVGAKTAFIAPGSPWENGYCESFNARFRDKLLNGEVFYSLREAQILIERWRRHYNTVRPHSDLGYRPPAPKKHHANRPEANHALTINLNHSVGALHWH